MKENPNSSQLITIDMELLAYLSEASTVCNRLFAFHNLLQQAVKEPTDITKRGIVIHLEPGQLEASILALSNKWKWHRKTITSFLDELERRGYIKRMSNKLSTIIEMTCLRQSTTEPETDCTAQTPVICAPKFAASCTSDFQNLPNVAHQAPPMQLTNEVRQLCRKAYDLFIEMLPLLDKPAPYNANIEKDIYYVFCLGMHADFDLLKKYFDIIRTDPFKNGTLPGMSPNKESFSHLFSTNWQLVLDCGAEFNRVL